MPDLGKLAVDGGVEGGELGGGLRRRDAGAKARDELVVRPDVAGVCGGEVERLPELRRVRGGEARGHDADDRAGVAVEVKEAAEDVRVGVEGAPPQRVAKDHRRRGTGQIIGRGEGSAKQRRDAEGGEVTARHAQGANGLAVRLAEVVGNGEVGVARAAVGDAHAGEAGGVMQQKVGGDAELFGSGWFRGSNEADADEAGGFGIGQRRQQDGADEREDGGGGADTEGEREHGGGRKGGRAAQLAKGEAEILREVLEECSHGVFPQTCWLLGAQGLGWVGGSSAPRGHERRKSGKGEQCDRGDRRREQVERRRVIKEAVQDAAQRE